MNGATIRYLVYMSYPMGIAMDEAPPELAGAPGRECAANARLAMGVRSCIEDEGRPLEAGRQGQASNYRKLRR